MSKTCSVGNWHGVLPIYNSEISTVTADADNLSQYSYSTRELPGRTRLPLVVLFRVARHRLPQLSNPLITSVAYGCCDCGEPFLATQTWQRWSEMYARRRPSLPLSAWEFRGPLEEDAVGRGSAGGSGSRRSPGNADPVIAAAEADSPNFRSGSPPELDPEPRASRCPLPPSLSLG